MIIKEDDQNERPVPIASKGPELLEAAFDVCGFFSHSCDSIIFDEIKERVVKHIWTPWRKGCLMILFSLFAEKAREQEEEHAGEQEKATTASAKSFGKRSLQAATT
jgi:hypothetical protein